MSRRAFDFFHTSFDFDRLHDWVIEYMIGILSPWAQLKYEDNTTTYATTMKLHSV